MVGGSCRVEIVGGLTVCVAGAGKGKRRAQCLSAALAKDGPVEDDHRNYPHQNDHD